MSKKKFQVLITYVIILYVDIILDIYLFIFLRNPLLDLNKGHL